MRFLVSNPYRWLPRTVWKNVSHWYWDIKNGCANLYTFFWEVWWFRGWDWTGTVGLIRACAMQMRRSQEVSYHLGASREVRRLTILIGLCDRMLADNYTENAGYESEHWSALTDDERRRIFKHVDYMEKQDSVYLGNMLRHIRLWWA